MAKTLLRSGSFDDFLALGEGGQTIYDSALQIRETLRLRKQQMLADSLAIPQPDENREKIDWYAPHNGTVTTWSAATEQQREKALHHLDNCLTTVKKMSWSCQQNEKSAIQLFGALLDKVFRFPTRQHVYLVDSIPVITFWGFDALDAPLRQDPLAELRISARPSLHATPEIETKVERLTPAKEALIVQPQPAINTLSHAEKPLFSPPSSVVPMERAAPSVAPVTGPLQTAATVWPKILRLVALVGLLLIVALAIWANFPRENPPSPPKDVPEIILNSTQPPSPPPPLPLTRATVNSVAEVVQEKPPRESASVPEIQKTQDALVMPAALVRAGTTEFLNGKWRATVGLRDPISGKQPVLRYQINNNAGTVQLTLSDKTICRTDVSAGLMQSGNLVIKTRGKARCTDDTRHSFPEVSCSQGGDGAAQCVGRFENDIVASVTFRKVSK